MSRVYKGYFDIEHMINTAVKEHICFVIAVSADSQRGAGKTYSTAKFLYNHYIEKGEKFMIFVRHVKELGNIAQGIFGNFLLDNYPDVSVYEKKQDNVFSYIYATSGKGEEKTTEIIGYVVPLKNAPGVKQYRGIFQNNVRYFYMDEFMPLDGRYLPNETRLMKTIYDTVNGQLLDLPIILTANCLSLGNPYFTMLKLNGKLQSSTKKLKTETCVYENITVEGLEEKHLNSAANKAFGQTDDEYVSNMWIMDNNSLVCKPDGWGRAIYICTLLYDGKQYGVHAYYGSTYYYISNTVDKHCDYVYNVKMDGDLNIPLLRSAPFLKQLRDNFYRGNVRVSTGEIQRMLIEIFG
ncbi:MAG: phage DNA encapsidation protein [Methanobrevibacter sp.]|nr:phage DNA encapsidation protein [Methanobrevibacter sp.]